MPGYLQQKISFELKHCMPILYFPQEFESIKIGGMVEIVQTVSLRSTQLYI